jgi:sn-glycerol 3-phosphate transport system permease protein
MATAEGVSFSSLGRERSGRRGIGLVGRYALLVLTAFIVLIPIYMTVVNSLLTPDRLLTYPPKLIALHPKWNTYKQAWDVGNLGQYLVNSFVVSIAIVAGQVVTSVLAAYAFAFLRFPLRNVLFVVFLATLMVPSEVTIISNYQTVQSLHWIDTYQGLIVPFLATAFGTFLLRQAFLTVPRDLRDAAALDGYGHVGFMTRVVVPLCRPAVAALAVFSFLLAWNQYLWPLLITNKASYRTVQVGVKVLAAQNLDRANLIFAGTVIAAVPIFVLLVVFQRHLIRGLTAGAVKG